MKAFFYKLLSRGLLILLLLALAAGYYYRAELFPQFFGSEATETEAASVTSDAPAPSRAEPVAVPVPAAPAETAGSEPAQVAPDSVEAAPEPSVDAVEAPRWPTAAEPEAGADAQAGQTDTSPGDPADDALQSARNAYWAGDLDGAVAAYERAASARPDDPDVHGELGNIYFAQGNWEQASAAYLAAGKALLARGDRVAAEHLMVVLQGLNPEHAQQLADALEQQPASGRP